MITDEQINDFCTTFLTSSPIERGKIIGEVIERADEPEYEHFAARVIYLLRLKHRLDDAEAIVGPLISCGKYEDQALWELGYAFGVAGQPHRSIEYLNRSVAADPQPHRLLWLAVQLAISKQDNEAYAVLTRVQQEHPALEREVAIHRQFFSMLKTYDRSEAQRLLLEVRARFANRSVSDLEADIQAALDARQPYLLLRLGDGEGACIRLSAGDEENNKDYYRANRDEFAEIWFKDRSVLDGPAFLAAIDEFNSAISQADAIGGSMYEAAIQTEYDYASRRGIAWVVNVMRRLLAFADEKPDWAKNVPVYSLTIHYDLLLSGALARLLKRRSFVGVISCQDALPSALQRTYGIGRVDLIKTPGEQIHAGTLGASAVEGRHWPDRFNEIIGELSVPTDRRGQLWLVAAGMLGKIYAAKLKKQGAVVIDIGAVADLWMGKVTRSFPDLPPESKLKLEQSMLTLVDVGGLGGLGEEWLPHVSSIRAVLFEPNPSEAAMARAKLEPCRDGIVVERALGNRAEKRTLHVTRSLGCTSLLDPNNKLLQPYTIAPAFRVTHEIEVDCERYDTLMVNGEVPQPDAIKIDVQGFEYQVLEGFGNALNECLGVKVEAHFRPIYHGQKLLHDMVDLLSRAGLSLRRLQPVDHFDGDIVEVDAWFTCSPERAAALSEERAAKLAFLEMVWEIPPRRLSFGADQFS
ncbi:FkbM family methyltransferase [Methylorubrum extorquens]|uniref:FkbM family methyltransferase n=1 Tax=Methylorubrum extorquens TaxID=408 RepID=UPI0015FDDDAD|nr:FkbM family methyltransferase [Methylorubrum extorquens]MBA9067404.1 FkbM family methyltransferase [Methylobacterium sp. RAS18]UYW25922.1 FkbM family methyltransferase [Methylorubrum extorquens]UYW34272.1 FkbM family methyltransferase [Methylorubrum extorquens]